MKQLLSVKKYNFWDYIKMIMSVALIFTLGVLWSNYLIVIGNKVTNLIENIALREIIALVLIIMMTMLVIVIIVYIFKYEGEEALNVIKSGI
jgi:amino acid permease